MWNFKIEEIDEIAIDFDPSKFMKNFSDYKKICNGNDLYYKIKDEENPFKQYGVKNIFHVNHHYSHALSTWMLEDNTNKPKTRIVIDGIGDGRTFTVFKNNKIIRVGKVENGSIGLKMEWAGEWLNIKSQYTTDHSGKVMGIQSYGNIDDGFLNNLCRFGIDEVNEIFDINTWRQYKNDSLLPLLMPLDWIKTVHERIGDIIVEFFKEYVDKDDIVSYSGGVAQNVVWNTKLIKNFNNIIIPPHAGDEGLSLGGIEFLRIKNNLSSFTINNFPYSQNDYAPDALPSEETIKTAAKLLSEGKIIGWYQGNGEVGPRALGNRSILMDPRIHNGKEIINGVKNRENYRPFGASILAEHIKNYFDLNIKDDFMLFTNNFITKEFPAITHVDGTCRVQAVEKNNKIFRKLLDEFYNITGCPIILNTSLNINGKPIAGYPENAINLFETTSIDYMFIGNKIYSKD